MGSHRSKQFKALEKDIKRGNAQFDKVARGITLHPHGMVTLNKHRQAKRGKK